MRNADLPAELSAPAKRALESAGVRTLADLAKMTEVELVRLHGIGHHALTKLKAALAEAGLAFKQKKG